MRGKGKRDATNHLRRRNAIGLAQLMEFRWRDSNVRRCLYRREDAKEKKATMETYWVPGVNHLGSYGRWAFSEFTDIYQIDSDFKAKVKSEFDKMIASAWAPPADRETLAMAKKATAKKASKR